MKHIPERMCVVCREKRPKEQLVRLVKADGDLVIDLTGRMHGRGSYLDLRSACVNALFKGKRLEKQLGVHLTSERRDELQTELAAMAAAAEATWQQLEEQAQRAKEGTTFKIVKTKEGLIVRKVGSNGQRHQVNGEG